jgi:hypothetical protein
MTFFNDIGRRIPSRGLRIFSEKPLDYYKINEYQIDYSNILLNSIRFGGVNATIKVEAFESECNNLRRKFEADKNFQNLFKGIGVPFICKENKSVQDLGKDLQDEELPNFQRAFNSKFPNHHFKAILQSDSKLAGSIALDPRSRYSEFVDACKAGTVIGWYFPQALQEFDVESQRLQMAEIPEVGNICLSGGIDIMAALIGNPGLLISEKSYAPILCLSAYVHKDPRLVILIKSYGGHMEFWCMTQMLTKNIKQVSEQWSGGITIFKALNK